MTPKAYTSVIIIMCSGVASVISSEVDKVCLAFQNSFELQIRGRLE